ncbi:MAG TPA: DUF917 domain-containing protein [Jatrophihabitans sp.]|jgi:hypothetical protein
MPSLWIGHDDVEDLGLGASALGTGGGGSSAIVRLMLHEAIDKHGPVEVVALEDLDPKAMLFPVAFAGAPVAYIEKCISGNEATLAYELASKRFGRAPIAVLPLEVGGASSLYPLVVAAELGIPCVDADTIRRAFPMVHMTQFTLAGISVSPCFVIDIKGNALTLDMTSNVAGEAMMRAIFVEMGMFAVVAGYFVTVQQTADHGVPGSLTYALELGRRISRIQHGFDGAYEGFLRCAEAQALFEGKIVDLDRRTEDGWSRGTVKLESLDDPSKTFEIDFQNENLVARSNGIVVATVPDLITLIDLENAVPMTTEELAYGQRMRVIAMPAHERWLTPPGLELVGPRAFGYDFDYISYRGVQ